MFKRCTMCEKTWESMDEFINDNDLILNGYQVNIMKPMKGMFIFTHSLPECGTSVGIRIEKFQDFADAPMPHESIVRPEDCPGHCLDEHSVAQCKAIECPGQSIRALLHKLEDKKNVKV